MFYYKITADTPYCGTEMEDYVAFEERPTNAELDEIAEEIDNYYADCSGTWVEVSEEEYLEEMG